MTQAQIHPDILEWSVVEDGKYRYMFWHLLRATRRCDDRILEPGPTFAGTFLKTTECREDPNEMFFSVTRRGLALPDDDPKSHYFLTIRQAWMAIELFQRWQGKQQHKEHDHE